MICNLPNPLSIFLPSLTCGGFGLEIGCALVTGTLWGVVTPPLSPVPGKEKDGIDETAGDVTPGRTLVLQEYKG